MHTKYHTEGIVLQHFDTGESDRTYVFFTRNLGLIYAKAKSVRALKSKIRYGLQTLSSVDLTLIRTHENWKIASARPKQGWHHIFEENMVAREVFGRILKLFRKLVTGEEPNEKLYMILEEGLSYASRHDLSPEDFVGIEILLVLRMLRELGYLQSNFRFDHLLAGAHVNDIVVHEALRNYNRAVYSINMTFKESGL